MTPERRNRIESVLSKRQNDLTIILANVSDPHNISAVMRTCDAIGVQEVYVLNTRIPPHEKWGSRSSSSAVKWITIHQYDSVGGCFSEIRKRYSKILTTSLAGEFVSLYNIDFTQSMALVFGNEHAGLEKEITSLADGNFIIPQVGMIQSLNISVACAVSLYEAFRQKKQAGHYDKNKLLQNQYDSLYEKWKLNNENIL